MSRTVILSVLAATIALASSADAAHAKGAKKGILGGGKDLAPVDTSVGAGIDLAPLDPPVGNGKIDVAPAGKHDVDPAASAKKLHEPLDKGNVAFAPAVTAAGPGIDLSPLEPSKGKAQIDPGPIVKHKAAPEPKAKQARQPLGKGNLAFAPAVTAAGVGTDVAPLDPRDGTAVDVDPQAPTVIICFTDEMLRQYLHWLGVDLETALRYGLLEDPRLISMFFDSLRRGADKAAQADAAGEDTWLVDFQLAR
ncbi:MAG TPA: hypothetical protein VKF62_10590 [Planctomycetota bacterium]|nr:hypothetical protein [Planctomycetota bacterium]